MNVQLNPEAMKIIVQICVQAKLREAQSTGSHGDKSKLCEKGGTRSK
jgi:hypothetical protein